MDRVWGTGVVVDAGAHAPRLAWSEIDRRAAALATSLGRQGIGHGDVVVAAGVSSVETLLLTFAAWRCGAAVSLAFTRPVELARRVEQLGARAVYAPSASWSDLDGAVPSGVVRLDESAVTRDGTPRLHGGRVRALSWPPAAAAPDHVAIYQATSGTTGAQQMVPVTWAMLTANLQAIAGRLELDDTDRLASWMPLYHDMGLVGFLLLPAFLGAGLTLVPTEAFARSPSSFLGVVATSRATMSGSPTFGLALMERSLRRQTADLDLSSLERIGCGAEMIDLAICERFLATGRRHRLRPDVLAFAYGMAEATLAVSIRPPAPVGEGEDRSLFAADAWRRPDGRGFARTGRPVDGVAVRVVRPADRQPCDDAEVGEIEVRGRSVTGEGWLPTGDLGYLTDGGEIVVVGRSKDVLVVGGRNVVPDDVEHVVAELPGIRTVAAVPVRGEAGEGFAVVAELRPGAATSAREVRVALRQALDLTPDAVRFVDRGRLPTTTSGKLRRGACRELVPAANHLPGHPRDPGTRTRRSSR